MSKKSKQGKAVKTEISVHPEMEGNISKFQMECLEDEVKSLPFIKEGEVDINTDFFFELGDKYEASIFIRNGLNIILCLEEVSLAVVNEKNEVLGNKTFDLREVGEIPPKGVRPWKLYFNKNEINIGKSDIKKLNVVFTEGLKAEKIVDVKFENFPSGVDCSNKRNYDKFIETLPLLREGQVSISAYKVYKNSDESISSEIIIRNTMENSIEIKHIPISIFDVNNQLVASGIFYLKDVIIESFKARVYSVTFKKDEIIVNNPDFTEWDVEFKLSNVNN